MTVSRTFLDGLAEIDEILGYLEGRVTNAQALAAAPGAIRDSAVALRFDPLLGVIHEWQARVRGRLELQRSITRLQASARRNGSKGRR